MFSSCTKNFSSIQPNKNPLELNILICGVHNAGKTTTVRRLLHLGHDVIPDEPTYGRKDFYLNYKHTFKCSSKTLEQSRRTFGAGSGNGGNAPVSPAPMLEQEKDKDTSALKAATPTAPGKQLTFKNITLKLTLNLKPQI